MKIRSLSLKNFRAYKDVKVIFDENMNVIIGKNDIGKSTILESLDIFFGQEVIKIDITDWNKEKESNKIIIGVEFLIEDDFKIIIDTSNPTNLKDEFLINNNGYFEVIKEFEIKDNKLSKEKVFINANYPSIFEEPLINLKIKDLQSILKNSELKSSNNTISAEIRKTLYSNLINENTEFSLQQIDITKEDAKKIWENLQKELPLYFLFQSDRANKDSDSDIQNPLKTATRRIVANFEEEFKIIKDSLEFQLNKIGIDTIDKMKDMGLEVANDLIPKVSHKSLDTLFSFTLESDDGIALNKRGSGFRRMIMLNYFRAEAERKIAEKNNKNVIYAIEEPETAQHPNHQKMLIEALIELSNQDNHQIILTTHTPEIAKMVDETNLIMIKKNENNQILIEDGNDKIKSIIETLGILPNINIENIQKVKVVICFEGYTDIEFIRNINNIQDFREIININDESILLIFLGGGTLQHYINYNYLDKLNIPQIHIYDSDFNQKDEKLHYQYKKYIDKINDKLDSNYGFMTNKAEIENYIHPNLIKDCYKIDTCFHKDDLDWLANWSKINLPKFINENTDKNDPQVEPISSERMSKKHLAIELSKKLTKEHLIELEAFEEIKNWFVKIKELSE
jgi:putative ATP-dependent endonuclease of the OLD family